MSSRDFDSSRLDVAAFAKAAGEIGGNRPVKAFRRLSESAIVAPTEGDEVRWHARGESRAMRSGEAQVWLHVSAVARLALECQRCLKAIDVSLDVAHSFLFVHGEETAAQLDADSEDDVLALTRALDLHELIEDELLLALPLVPRHDTCPVPLLAPVDEEIVDDGKPNPFAALAALKRPGLPN